MSLRSASVAVFSFSDDCGCIDVSPWVSGKQDLYNTKYNTCVCLPEPFPMSMSCSQIILEGGNYELHQHSLVPDAIGGGKLILAFNFLIPNIMPHVYHC